MKQDQLKNYANNIGPLNFFGPQEILCGNRIVHGQPKDWWRSICFHKDKSIFVAMTVTGEIDREVGWYQRWQGMKVVPQMLCYHGSFYYFYRHTVPEKPAIEWENKGIDCLFQGDYQYDYKHGKGCFTAGNQIRESGEWQKGYRQWKFKREYLQNGVATRSVAVYFYNNVQMTETASNNCVAKRFAGFPVSRACCSIAVTEQLVNSLHPGQWVTSSVVDLFVNHLQKSFYDSQRPKKEIRYFRVDTFQNMVPSLTIEHGETQHVPINYKQVERFSEPYRNLFSIFHKYPLILMPYNIGASHFELLYIRSHCTYTNGKLEKVEFVLGHLDPLYQSKVYIFDYLKQYILKEVETNVHSAERHLYRQALKEALANPSKHLINRNNKEFTKQRNSYDCGMFVCLYMLLLTAQVGLGLSVDWLFPDRYATKLRKLLEKDAMFGVGNFLELLIERVVEGKGW